MRRAPLWYDEAAKGGILLKDLLLILVPVAIMLPLVLLGMYAHSCSIRRRLTRLLTRLSRGEAAQAEDFSFDGVRLEQLRYPFTAQDGQIIAAARELHRETLTVTLTRPLQAVFGDYAYHISGCFEGLDARGNPFRLKREGWLCITCTMRRGHIRPCITQVQARSRSPHITE